MKNQSSSIYLQIYTERSNAISVSFLSDGSSIKLTRDQSNMNALNSMFLKGFTCLPGHVSESDYPSTQQN
ncbi:hypothetical protein YC2023_061797 [Brassica napus]